MPVKYPEFGDYFKELIKNYSDDKGQEFLAQALMCSQSLISKICNGMALPTELMIKQMDILWDIDISDKVAEAKKLYDWQKKPKKASNNTTTSTKPRLPITAAAGQLSDYLGGVLAHECEQLPIMRSMPEYDFTMIVKGDSMEPKFEGGDEIACKKVENVIEWGKAYVLATRDGAVLKRLYETDNGVRCVSYNHDEYPDFVVNSGDILGVYRVVGLIRV